MSTFFSMSGASPPMKAKSNRCKRQSAVVVDRNLLLLKVHEVAALCGVSVSCVPAWRFARKIPFVELNGKTCCSDAPMWTRSQGSARIAGAQHEPRHRCRAVALHMFE
jgi:hypothetical protein